MDTRHLARHSNLTQGQRLIWTGQRLDPDVPLYNMGMKFVIEQEIDHDVFRRAFQLLLDTSDALRVVIKEIDGVPQQHVSPKFTYDMPCLDFSGERNPQTAVDQWIGQRCVQLFDLDRRLFDSALLRVSDSCSIWYLNQHHLITDAGSTTLLCRRMEGYYDGLLGGSSIETPELPSYQSYVRYERAARSSSQYDRIEAYWKQKQGLSVRPPRLYGKPPTDSTRTERISCDLGFERSERLRRLAQSDEVRSVFLDFSLFNIFVSLLFAFLHRISGQRVLALGAPAHSRPTREFKETVGLCTEVFPLHIEVDETESFLSLLKKVQVEASAFLRFAQSGASDVEYNRCFNAVLNYIHLSFDEFCGSPMRSEWIHPGHCDRGHYLRLHVHDLDRLGQFLLHFDLNCEIFEEERRTTAIGHFLRLVDGFIEDWNQPIQQVDLLSNRERKRQIIAFNNTHSSDTPAETVVEWFEAQVARTPRMTALVYGEQELSYQALNRQSNHWAGSLRRYGVVPGALVGICLNRSPDAVIAILAVLKAGAAYVPVDPSYPRERIAYILDDAGAQVVLTQSSIADGLPTTAETVCVDGVVSRSGDLDTPREKTRAGADAAYVIYTSGSTGRPKGVVVPHSALVNYIHWACKQYVGSRKLAFPLFSPLSFDLTVTSIFVPLVSGGQIVVYPESRGRADLALLDVLADDRVDIIKLTPSHLTLIQRRDLSDSRVKQLILGGEELRSDLAQNVSDKFGGEVRIHNEYGPTEATVGCILHTFDPSNDSGPSVPIGRPIDNMQAYLLNSHLSPVPEGVVGELYVAGDGLASGYWNHLEQTAARFIRNPFRPGTILYRTGDLARMNSFGDLEYLGRNDHQVKIRGARIELGEIEAALSEHSQVDTCVVHPVERVRPAPSGKSRHCARCGLPSNYPGTRFDNHGVCNICTAFDSYRSRAERYFKKMDDLRAVLEEPKRSGCGKYDCLSLLSGGKDSTYALCQLVDMGFRVLAFTLDNGYLSDQAKGNIQRVVETLGVDHVFGSTPAMKEIFADSLNRHSNVCNGCFKTIYTLSMRLAREKGIPFIVTGLSRGQFFETRLTEELFTDPKIDVDDIDQTILDARKAYHRVDDAVSQRLDVEMFAEDRIFEEVRFIDFYRYCPVELDDVLKYLNQRVPWIRPSDTGRSTNCLINDVGIYVHQRERGYHNYALPYSWDVRLGHKARDAALAELNDVIDEQEVRRILGEVGYDEHDVLSEPSSKSLVAYYAGSGEVPISELRRHIESRLPDYMMPTHFVLLDEMPLTPNCKIDRSALPAPDPERPVSDSIYVAPHTTEERLLAGIWEEVLRVDRIGIHDNFFDLGGDSIMAIQIISRANRAGLQLAPAQLFETLTVEQLAAAHRIDVVLAEQSPVTGPVPLLPIQRWFFEQNHPDPSHWNHALIVSLSDPLEPGVLEASLRDLLLHHDALRLRFVQESGIWRSYNEAAIRTSPMTTVDVSRLDSQGRKARIADVEEELNKSITLSSGELFKAALFVDRGGSSQLLLVVHHLAVDKVSWPILLEDLASLCQQRLRKRSPVLPRKTTSFQQWSEVLLEHARSSVILSEADFWRTTLQMSVSDIPVDFDHNGANTQGSADTVTTRLEGNETRALVEQVPLVHRLHVNEILLAALAMTFSRWTGNRNVEFNLEGHGREPLGAAADISRTIGWFTSLYPVRLSLPKDLAATAVLRSAKDQLRRIPNRGIGYGLLRYLSPKDKIRQEFSLSKPPQVLFNYLGRADQLVSKDSSFRICRPLVLSRSPKCARPHLLEINVFIIDERLHADWTFSHGCHSTSTIQHLAHDFLTELRSLMDHCLSLGGGDAAATDFPLANLDQDKLEKLSALLHKTDGGPEPVG